MTDDERLRYPIGRFQGPFPFNAATRAAAIDDIRRLPLAVAEAVRGLTDAQLDTPYRDGGWTVRQLVHHIADSHMNAYVRFKLVASEDNPLLKAYDENAWSAMADARTMPIGTSLALIEAVHARWVRFLESLDEAAFGRPGQHTENGPVTIDLLLQDYSWHGRHHTAHITELRKRKGW